MYSNADDPNSLIFNIINYLNNFQLKSIKLLRIGVVVEIKHVFFRYTNTNFFIS